MELAHSTNLQSRGYWLNIMSLYIFSSSQFPNFVYFASWFKSKHNTHNYLKLEYTPIHSPWRYFIYFPIPTITVASENKYLWPHNGMYLKKISKVLALPAYLALLSAGSPFVSQLLWGRDTLSWQRPNSDPYSITTKWLAVNLKLPKTSHGRF